MEYLKVGDAMTRLVVEQIMASEYYPSCCSTVLHSVNG